jgi:hypothetical protein
MRIEQIKKSVDAGLKVFWKNEGYRVIKGKYDRYFIEYTANGHVVYLEHEFEGKDDNPDFFGAYVR